MTGRLAVGATATAAFRFTFENYLRLLGVMWAPMIVMLIATVWQLFPYVPQLQAGVAANNPQALTGAVEHLLIFQAIGFALLAVITVGTTKLALGRPTPWPFFYFSLAGDYWRLLLAYFLVFLIVLVSIVPLSDLVGLTIDGVLGGVYRSNPAQIPSAVARYRFAIGGFVVYGVIFFIFARLAFLLPPIVVSERRIGLGRNWTLSQGNFWRLLGLLIGGLIPLFALVALQFLVMAVLGGASFNIFSAFHSHRFELAWTASLWNLCAQHWLIYIVSGMLLSPFVYGPPVVASVLAYRSLVPDNPADAFA